MRLGISSYTYVWSVGVPGFPQPAKPLTAPDLLEKATELGIHVVQIADNIPLDRFSSSQFDELTVLAKERSIALEVGTCGVEPNHLRTYLEIAIRLRSPIVRTVIDTEATFPTSGETIAAIQAVLPEFSRAGVSLAIENHDRFPAIKLKEIIARCDSRHVGICLDTANSLGCGEDLHSVLRALGPFVLNLHIKDFRARRLPHKKGFTMEGCPAGQGLVDIPHLIAELKALHRDPSVILELWPPPESTIEQSIAKEESWTRESIRYLHQFVEN